ncbi:MBL fold metallo-hydrolase [Streptomyces olivaceoviridis]|uniref:MBL fold metallo-hydrolase n=1 Tax=Streptomyces olivaceoviridis TaxID=1921 RepID=UPI0036FBBC0E
MRGAVRVERVVTSGTFSLDGGTFDVDTNVWLVGDDEVLVPDAAHDAGAIHHATAGRRATADRRVTAIVCTHAPFLNAVFTGDTLFHGGPGATGRSYSHRSYSDRPAIEASIRARPLPLPGDTVVHTGHGRDTTTPAERPSVPTA